MTSGPNNFTTPVASAVGLSDTATAAVTSLVRRHRIRVEQLTEEQLVDAIKKMLPDFQRIVSPNPGRQTVVYLPGLEVGRLRQRVAALEETLADIFHHTDCTTRQMEMIEEVLPQSAAQPNNNA